MRIAIVGFVAALGFSVSACASAPRRDAVASEVPMYTNAEWAQMNSESSVPEISDPAELASATTSLTQAPMFGRSNIFESTQAGSSLSRSGSFGFSSGSVFGHIHGHLGGGHVSVHGHF